MGWNRHFLCFIVLNHGFLCKRMPLGSDSEVLLCSRDHWALFSCLVEMNQLDPRLSAMCTNHATALSCSLDSAFAAFVESPLPSNKCCMFLHNFEPVKIPKKFGAQTRTGFLLRYERVDVGTKEFPFLGLPLPIDYNKLYPSLFNGGSPMFVGKNTKDNNTASANS